MGGKTAMVLAQKWPELISKLIVVDISPREHENNHDHIVDAVITADLSEAVKGAQLIVCPAPATAQMDIARALAPLLADGQVVDGSRC